LGLVFSGIFRFLSYSKYIVLEGLPPLQLRSQFPLQRPQFASNPMEDVPCNCTVLATFVPSPFACFSLVETSSLFLSYVHFFPPPSLVRSPILIFFFSFVVLAPHTDATRPFLHVKTECAEYSGSFDRILGFTFPAMPRIFL